MPPTFKPNCRPCRHYDRGKDQFNGVLTSRYLTEDNSTCLRPPPAGAALGPPGWGGTYNGERAPCLSSHDLSAKEEAGVCEIGAKKYLQSGHLDGADWDAPEAYKGGALPDWNEPDPADTGRAAKTLPYKTRPIGT